MSRALVCPSCSKLNRIRADKLGSGPKCGHCKSALDTSGAPRPVDDAELSRLIRSSPVPVLVDFYADWCGPCRSLAPHLEQLGKNHPGALMVVKVDTERHQEHARQLGVQGIPALYLYRDGKVVEQTSGMRPLAFWEDWVRPHLS